MDKKFLIAWLLLFVVWMAGSFLVHGLLLGADYTALQGKLYRTEQDSQKYFPVMLLAHVLLAGAFCWIYARGREAGKAWMGQGLRFGLAVALLTAVPTYMIYYAVQPTPGLLAIKQMLFDAVLIVVLGVVVAWWYHRGEATA
jgi:drug/metabolite transporter (DMT)-like permease